MVICRTSASSVGVAGRCSDSKESRRDSKSDSLSPGKTRVAAVSPCLTPFKRTAARPSGVFGPVLFCAFFLLAANCRADGLFALLVWRQGRFIVAGGMGGVAANGR